MAWYKAILRLIQNSARRRSLIAATRQANRICMETGKTMIVYFYKGEYKYISKQEMKKAGMSGEEIDAIAHGKIVRYMKPKEKALETAVTDKKLTPADVKKLQQETIKKQGKIVIK